ncbi:DUF4238 domain-containing protein, partial [Frankia sp. Cr1]|uniref:DUF4238 domain-containing protein n=1 Tax=Frankia sp. Cr1 TaxID=3073931 RepID=UPI002AD3634C
QGSPARKHHLVPRSYLDRWVEADKVRVTEPDTQHTYVAAPTAVARETDYYRLESEDIDAAEIPPLLFETLLSDVEGHGKTAIDELLARSPDEIDPELMAWFFWYLSFQFTRGRSFREQQRRLAQRLSQLNSGIIAHEMRESLHGAIIPTADEVRSVERVADAVEDGTLILMPQEPSLIDLSMRAADGVGRYFASREWVVYRTPPILVTCDEPVVVIGGPGQPRGRRGHLADAGVVILPLTPSAVLAMFRPDRMPPPTAVTELDHAETLDLNREIIANSVRWVFDQPSRRTAEKLRVPLAPPALGEDEPVEVVNVRGGRAIRVYQPTRWDGADLVPDWPVARWWR